MGEQYKMHLNAFVGETPKKPIWNSGLIQLIQIHCSMVW